MARGARPERLPYAVWRHFPDDDQSPEALAEQELAFWRRWRSDFIKLNPSGWYWVEGRGVAVERFGDRRTVERVVRRAVNAPEDWGRLALGQGGVGTQGDGPAAGGPLAERLAARARVIRAVRREVAGEVPLFETVFSPLTLAYKLAGGRLRDDLDNPALAGALQGVLEALTQEVLAYLRELERLGVEGVFYAIQTTSADTVTAEQFRRWGLPYDRQVLEEAGRHMRWRLLHLHGSRIFFDDAVGLPAEFVGWHVWSTPPDLGAARARTGRAFAAAFSRETVLEGPPEAIRAQVRQAIDAAGGRGLLLAPDCTVSPSTPDAHWEALVEACRELGSA